MIKVATIGLAAAISASTGGEEPVAANDIFPGVDDFRMQTITRTKNEADWPFVPTKGLLLCAKILRQPAVYFVGEDQDGEQMEPFVISTDMVEVAIANIGTTGVLRPYDGFEQLLKRLVPYVSMGRRLCDQPPGTNLPDSAL